MNHELIIHQPWKPGESQLDAFELTLDDECMPQTRELEGGKENTSLTNKCIKATDLIILKIIGAW